ncbi:MAG: sporulation protein YqfD [Lachnospiraceae bacterium]|nr:sporulation protein YqfD [Lachnospiraceae bacterium]
MLTNIIKFLKGYVVIQLTGYSPERFLNLCSHHQIVLWGLRSTGNEYEMCISISGFKKLRPLVHKTRTKVVILERHGLPFVLYRYQNRKLFVVGALAGGILLYVMSLFIWNIHIEGNYSLSDQVILNYLESEQIVHGMAKSRIHGEEIEADLREHFTEITWTSAEVKGTRLIIHVQENEDVVLPDIPEDKPADLVASDSGRIVSMIVRSGTPTVSEGQEVQKGDVLVQSRVEILDDAGEIANVYYVHADADIVIQRTESYKASFPMEYSKKIYTGKKQTSYYMVLGTKRLNFQLPRTISYENSDDISSEYQCKITEHFYLPLIFGKCIRQEYVPTPSVYTKDEAVTKAKEENSVFFEKLRIKGLQIIENNVKIDISGGVCTASGSYIVEEAAVQEQTPEIIIPDQTEESDEERE